MTSETELVTSQTFCRWGFQQPDPTHNATESTGRRRAGAVTSPLNARFQQGHKEAGLSQRSLDEYFYHIKQDELIGNRLPFGSPFRNLVGIFRCTPDRSRLASTRLLQRRCPCQGPPWRCLTPSPLGKPALYSYKPVWERDYEDGPTFPYVS